MVNGGFMDKLETMNGLFLFTVAVLALGIVCLGIYLLHLAWRGLRWASLKIDHATHVYAVGEIIVDAVGFDGAAKLLVEHDMRKLREEERASYIKACCDPSVPLGELYLRFLQLAPRQTHDELSKLRNMTPEERAAHEARFAALGREYERIMPASGLRPVNSPALHAQRLGRASKPTHGGYPSDTGQIRNAGRVVQLERPYQDTQ